VADEVKRARLAAGLSQERLALAIGVSAANYNKYETGKRRFTEAMLERIAAAPGMSLDLQKMELLSLIDQNGEDKIRQAYESILAKAPPVVQKAVKEHPDEFAEMVKQEMQRRKEKK